jgi:hypothetical protein
MKLLIMQSSPASYHFLPLSSETGFEVTEKAFTVEYEDLMTVDILVFDSDVDECLEDGICDGKCLNTASSYRCLCESGYRQLQGRCVGKCRK